MGNKRDRVRIVLEKLEDIKVEAFLVTDIKNIRYLTNFTGSSGFLLLTKKGPIFVTDFRYKTQAEGEVVGSELRIEKEKMPDTVVKLINEFRLKTVGFEAQSLTFDYYKKVSDRLNDVELKPTTNFIESLRVVKDEEEVISIRKAIALAEEVFNAIVEVLRPATVEKEIAIALEYELRKRGSGPIPFDIIIASGERAAMPHGSSSEKRLEEGDLVVIDWGAEIDGYNSDICRTILLQGRPLSEKEKIYRVVLDAQKEAIENARPGMTFSGLDAVARDFIEDAGYGEYFGHGLGHGVGLSVHEAPHISWQGEGVLEEGMVFTVEPGIYIPGLGGVRIEDMVILRKGGAEILTHIPKELMLV